jgi:hypothetical protein
MINSEMRPLVFGDRAIVHGIISAVEHPADAGIQAGKAVLKGAAETVTGLAVLQIPRVAEGGCTLTCELSIEENQGEGAGLFMRGSKHALANGLVLLLDPRGRATLR